MVSSNISKRTSRNIVVEIGPESRPAFLEDMQRLDGLTGLTENPNSAYCALSLTSTPDELKPIQKSRQELLRDILKDAGIESYDPGSSPFSPDMGLHIRPDEIYRVDKGRIVTSRFFATLDILPSTGVGVEIETARAYNRIAVVLHDRAIRTSRMQPNRIIHLQYFDLESQRDEISMVFKELKQFEPGMGLDNGVPALLGFRKKMVVNLEKFIYDAFPDLKYVFDGNAPIVSLKARNPGIFVENS